jgi:hypothetical protein
MQKYNEVSAVFEYWRLMLLVALTCFIRDKKQQLFFPKRRKKEKKDMRFNSHAAAAVKIFGKKILPARWRFFFQTRRA